MSRRLVIEWTRSSVRLAHAQGRGASWRLLGVRSEPLKGEHADSEALEALRALLKGLPLNGVQAIGVIPREQVITRVVKFPSVNLDELVRMVELYAKAQLPYPREQIVVDFHVLSQEERSTTVAIIACQREIIDRSLALMRDAGLPEGFLTVTSWGGLGWFQRLVTEAPKPIVESIHQPTLLVNVDDVRMDLVLIGEGRILSTRSGAQGVKDWEGVPVVEMIAGEIERSRAAVRKELPESEVRSVTLTGIGPLAEWNEPLSQRLGVPVVIVAPTRPFPQLPDQGPPASCSPLVVAGVASSDLRALLNVSPPEMRLHVRHHQQVRELVTVSALVMAVLACGAGLLSLQVSRHQRRSAQLERALSTLSPTAKHAQGMARAVELVTSVLEHRQHLAGTLAGVLQATPASITLEGITMERGKSEVTVRGTAASTQDVLGYINQLERVEGVKSVHLKYSTRRAMPTGDRADFELVLHAPFGSVTQEAR